MMHVDDETLSAYALDPAAVDAPEAVEAHLAECSSCREEVAAFRELDSLADDEDTWEAADAMLGPHPRLEEVLQRRNVMAAEEANAQRRLAPYLKSPVRFRGKRLADDPRLVTAGAVRVLCTAARGEHERRPRFSHALAVQACEIAGRLKGDDRGDCALLAYRERANALRYLGRFSEALDALEAAEKFVADTAAADFDRAIINYIRASILMKSERLTEATALARSAARTFQAYGDAQREVAAVMAEACCLSLVGVNDVAGMAFERVMSLARRTGDVALLSRAVNNAAVAYAALGDYDRASTYYGEAIALYEELRITTEEARARWGLAATLVGRGEFAAGADALAAARRELAAHGLTNDAALATLDWAEARLALGAADGVAEACRGIVLAFESEGMQRNARVALAYLHEALAKGTATRDTVHQVRRYLEGLPSAPERAFAPPS
jgi:tetratricopeptide (TPR) repeat protein